MVNSLIRNLYLGCIRFSSRNLFSPNYIWGTSNGSMVLVLWIVDGNVYSEFRYLLLTPKTFLIRHKGLLCGVVSELVSAYPTAGGMYFVTKHVVPEKHVPIWSWIVGWCNFIGQTAGASSVAYTVSQMMLACASMNSRFDGDSYAFSP